MIVVIKLIKEVDWFFDVNKTMLIEVIKVIKEVDCCDKIDKRS